MGIHLTIDGWRKGRETSGWRKKLEVEGDIYHIDNDSDIVDDGPIDVDIKPRLLTMPLH